MSDLQCAATLLLCCAAEAEYDGGSSLTLAGRARARDLGRALLAARISMVYSSGLPPAVQTAELAAAPGAAVVRVRSALGERREGESTAELGSRVTKELQTIVDQHRGETVLVVSHPAAVRSVVPLARNLPDDFAGELAPCAPIEVAVDGDGWLVRSWAGEPVTG